MLQVPQLKKLQYEEPYLYEALKKIVGAINALNQRLGADPTAPVVAPSPIAKLSVTAQNGYFDIAITDDAASLHGVPWYFIEYDTTPAFTNARVYFMGPSRNAVLALGNQTLYFRAYSQYFNSSPSKPVTFGSPPTAVTGGGSSPPPPQPAQGSGTSSSTGSGFGCCEIGTVLSFGSDCEPVIRVEPWEDWIEVELESGERVSVVPGTLVSVLVPAEELFRGLRVETKNGNFARVVNLRRAKRASQKLAVKVHPRQTYHGNGIRLHNLKAAPEALLP